MSDEEFLTAFLECRLPAAAFDHRAHLHIAWLLLRRYPLPEVVERICSGIERFATHLGAGEKYNRTLSEALVRLMAHAGATDPVLTWETFVRDNPVFTSDVRGLLERHYSADLLNSPIARQKFLSPDRLRLP